MQDFGQFLQWEAHSRDTIDFKKIYVDMAGDLNAGLMLSEIIFWYLPTRDGNSKLRVTRNGQDWIAVRRYQWWDRTRLTPEQADRALRILIDKGLVIKERFKFQNEVTVHVRIQKDVFLSQWKSLIDSPLPNPYSPATKMELGETPKSELAKHLNQNEGFTQILLTETTAETTTEIKPPIPPKGGHHKKSSTSEEVALIETTIEGYIKGLSSVPATNQYENTSNRKAALAIAKAGFTPEQVTTYTAVLQGQDYWTGKKPPLSTVAENIAAYFAAHKPKPKKEFDYSTLPENLIPLDVKMARMGIVDDGTPATPEQIAEAKRIFEETVKAVSGNGSK